VCTLLQQLWQRSLTVSALTHRPCDSESSTDVKGMAAASCATAFGNVVQCRLHLASWVNCTCTCRTAAVAAFGSWLEGQIRILLAWLLLPAAVAHQNQAIWQGSNNSLFCKAFLCNESQRRCQQALHSSC
jgi:hypothetical protein